MSAPGPRRPEQDVPKEAFAVPFDGDTERLAAEQRRVDATLGRYRQALPAGRADDPRTVARLGRAPQATVFGWWVWDLSGQAPLLVELGVLPPQPSLCARAARRWMRRGPATLVQLAAGGPAISTGRLGALGLAAYAGLTAVGLGAPLPVAAAAAAAAGLLPASAVRIADRLARRRVRTLAHPPAVLTALAAGQRDLVQLAAGCPQDAELGAVADLGARLLWDAAALAIRTGEEQPQPVGARHPVTARLTAYRTEMDALVRLAHDRLAAHLEREELLHRPLAEAAAERVLDAGYLEPAVLRRTAEDLERATAAIRHGTRRLHTKP
ncbi:hypothetical protein BIV57_13300 [Mangrovactinospora gilvigrisea]|uniref:Uncharacterized protein n=1 Tax=Mangrovactinospora gilvigrisea TaxID=1428644 RepID=A0A1J7C607_9ACTN|nr:hypothetical protein [Mangrovactinospora gilvigrisea]OIV36964.1 hypothetical protein BIV57_13300 [Mangrovactinospora gilvigrisea]